MDFGLERHANSRKSGVNAAKLARLNLTRNKKLAKAEDGNLPQDTVVDIDNGKNANVEFFEDFESFGNGVRGTRAMNARVHYILESRRNIADKYGSNDPETIENGVDASVGIATARGDKLRLAHAMLEVGIRDGRTDGIGIGVFVAYDVAD
jgi:hypothetical protein